MAHGLYKELLLVKDERRRDFVSGVLLDLPDYFWKIACSSTGKYHPEFATGEGGLVRHTRAAVKIASELFTIFNLTEREQDLVIISLLIHDGLKKGEVEGKHTAHEHPNLIAEFINRDKYKDMIDAEDLKIITSAVKHHMGQWVKVNYSKVVLEKPKGKIDNFVHMCDYLSSRKFLNIDFDKI